MSFRDLELLEAKGGNQEKYTTISTRLHQYAVSISMALLPHTDSVIRCEIADQAMGKVSDWFSTDRIMYLDQPWAYARKIVFNYIVDVAKSKKAKAESISFTDSISAGITVRDEMALIDEGFAKLDEGDQDSGDTEGGKYQGLGWRVFQKIDETPDKSVEDERYHEHKWIAGLNELFKYQWWWKEKYWRDKIEGERKQRMEPLQGSFIEARLKTKEYRERLWAKYNLIMGLINDISSPSEKRLMLHLFWGFKPIDISRELDVSKAYISKISSGKWMKMWGWEDNDVYQARLILLTHYLADWYKALQDRLRERELPRIGALDEQIRIISDDLLELESKQEDLRSMEKQIPQELISEIDLLNQRLKPLYSEIKSKNAILDIEIQIQMNSLYSKVIKSPQTNVYFHDLDKFEQSQISLHLGSKQSSLMNVCEAFFRHWYPGSKPIRLTDAERRRERELSEWEIYSE